MRDPEKRRKAKVGRTDQKQDPAERWSVFVESQEVISERIAAVLCIYPSPIRLNNAFLLLLVVYRDVVR